MGENGSLVYQNRKAKVVDAIKVKAVDTVGAGDCFAGAVANAYLYTDTKDLVKTVKFAIVIQESRYHAVVVRFLSEVQEYLVK